MLVGQGAACTELSLLLERGREGHGAARAIVGEAGIGKSALLDYAISRATGFDVLFARGVQSETSISFSGLSELLQPVLELIPDLPGPQATALSGALAIGPQPMGTDRFPVCAATLGVLVAAASRRPILVAVDDAQWLDEASTESLLFALRRLRDDPVVVLATYRLGSDLPEPPPGLTTMPVTGLDTEAAAALLVEYGHSVDDQTLVWLVQSTGGNPLAILELPKLLPQAELASRALSAEPVPVGRVIERAYGQSIGDLPDATRRALLIAAMLDGPTAGIVEQALRMAGLDLESLIPAERVHLVETHRGLVKFRHPLVRSAVHQSAAPDERRTAHRAIAAAQETAPGPYAFQSRAWHLAAATLGVDEGVAELLDVCASRAVESGNHHAGVLASERAAELSSDPARRSVRLLAAATSALTAGLPGRTAEILEHLSNEVLGEQESVAVVHLQGRLEMWSGAPVRAIERLDTEAARIRHTQPALAVALLIDAAVAASLAGEMSRAMELAETTAAICTVLPPGATTIADLMRGGVQALRGDGAVAVPLLDRAREVFNMPNPPVQMLEHLVYLGASYTFVDRFADAAAVLSKAITNARDHGAIGLLPFALGIAAVVDFRTGSWEAAYAGASEAVRLSEETARATDLPNALAVLALVEAGQGKEEAREHAQSAIDLAAAVGASTVEAQANSMLGLLELSTGRPEAAIPHLKRCGELALNLGVLEFGHLQWAPELIEALVRTGQSADAARTIALLEERATTGSPIVKAWTARCQGLLADNSTFEPRFRAALEHHRESASRPFEEARTQLYFGERLRRTRRRRDARELLQEAWKTFTHLGAPTWANRTATELAATGIAVVNERPHVTDLLTPQELQVALGVATGASNKQVAEQLFLTRKTVEFHLSRVYRKLGIGSRDELAALLRHRQGLSQRLLD